MLYRQYFLLIGTLTIILLFIAGVFVAPIWALLIVILPIYLLGIYDVLQKKHSILKLYPVIGHFRYLFEAIRPEIQQYFVETNINGTPVNREFRSLVYQRAKGVRDTRAFGTQLNVYNEGYEWVNHSLAPKPTLKEAPRVIFGEHNCKKPYYASPLNISAMSFGSLSKNSILSLNAGAQMGGFAHNTGEGGISPYHLEHGGDLIWQIGTGYFGCRSAEGGFDLELYKKNASRESVKMIELKLSQGAKPGHGGILPGPKVTEEIAAIRNVPVGKSVNSPPAHSAFNSPKGLLEFIALLRESSGGKPVGFKLCVGQKHQFLSICKAMLELEITPDFIVVDGGEGGTGAAPIELSNSVGMPLRDGLIFVDQALRGIGVRDKIRIVASGKVFSAFHIFRLLALGADTVNSARGMMFALGCIQALECNSGHCPTGIATQDPRRQVVLDVSDKSKRVYNYHHATVHNLLDLLGVAGLEKYDDVKAHHVNRRINSAKEIKTYAELFPRLKAGELLDATSIPEKWKVDWDRSSAESWE